ncbi:Ubiquitin-protein ligase E3A [Tolypocladium paradoxum]|uniref:HECT-type E3 ubiquitin transferase n=1 Tax=Tolypocladium paradoxum TaxID=94208 RepID=A0A2S4KUZ2_9HYPO|nr:Ubiquitin-protein ligase E3A [Tolypocladium paradoxum]
MTPSMHPLAGSDAPESNHGSRPGHRKSRRDAPDQPDLMAGLWQEAPFARLPDDAPQELRDLVQDIENPRRVYAIHRASRRHDFQQLVDRYVFQLRNGCGSPQCSTPTCFTCRKGLAGKAPIRRYNPTSARTLAVYLASQDNPDKSLCPYLRRSKEPPAAANTLIFTARFASLPVPGHKPASSAPVPAKSTPKGDSRPNHISSIRRQRPPLSNPHGEHPGEGADDRNHSSADHRDATPPPKLSMREQHVTKDYRSFAATAFGTVAFKMLEWLTPQSIEYMKKEFSEVSRRDPIDRGPEPDPVPQEAHTSPQIPRRRPSASGCQPDQTPKPAKHDDGQPQPTPPQPDEAPSPKKTSKHTRGSKGSFRAPSSSNPNRRGSLEPLPPPTAKEEPKQTPKNQPLNSFHPDKRSRTARIAPNLITRAVPEIPLKPSFFENVPCLSPAVGDVKEVDVGSSDTGDSDDDNTTRLNTKPGGGRPQTPIKTDVGQAASAEDSSWINYPLPQSLCRLNVELVDFICDTFQEDHTSEKQFFGPLQASESYPRPQNKETKLVRRRRPGHAVPRTQWKAFNEQTIFDVLSNPQSLVQSFTKDGKLYDSQTLWYCMLRMTRVAPSLVLHSLWMAARSLFVPPGSLRNVRSQTGTLLAGSAPPLSNFEAGCIMSVCLHALVAAAPCVSDSKTLYEMSRVRSNGLVVAGSGAAARQPSSMCLEYEDVFSNDVAQRLARRVFCAITARRCFADIADCDFNVNDTGTDLDVLRPLLSQLDLVSTGPVRILEFASAERLLHETRVPTLLLDWARAVLLREWDGRPEFSSEGPFHGALSLMATLHDNRNMLLLGDVQFRVDYFSERLDAMEMPVAWTAFTPTRQKRHLLDYPFIFSQEALVSFCRSINFSRMSRTFEESSSLKTRMSAIVDPGSLVTNPHHKLVLQDLLRTASSKYLVLEISRENVIRDAFDQLWRRQERELLRPLKIHLGEDRGEEGFDSGGVQQEFFRMAIAECLDPSYGAFTVDERTRMVWFVPGSLVEEWKFEMVGLLVSLAVYNGLTLPVTFPKALYRKLLGQPVEQLYHIADGWPELASGLTTLLEWDEKDGLVEDIFARTYEFSVSAFGSDVTRQMSKNGSSWPQGIPNERRTASRAAAEADEAPLVTNANRDDYVSDYIRYLTDISVRPQFLAFERGFRSCLDAKSLALLTPPILQSIAEGIQDIDISELRRYARYVGWDSSHHTVRDFWSIVRKYDDRMKRKLLEFVTASDRVPVGGMRNLQFVVQKNGEEDGEGGHLPTAYTCYGTLLLPEYRDKEVLRERLGMALENAQGFGFA